MTDPDRLKQLFQSALGEDFTYEKPRTRIFSKSSIAEVPAIWKAPDQSQARAPEPVWRAVTGPPVPPPSVRELQPMPVAGTDPASFVGPEAPCDSQVWQLAGDRRLGWLATFLVCIGLTGTGLGWFMKSSTRVQALRSAVAEAHSMGGLLGVVAKYEIAFERISTRTNAVGESSAASGADPTTKGDVVREIGSEAELVSEGLASGSDKELLREKSEI